MIMNVTLTKYPAHPLIDNHNTIIISLTPAASAAADRLLSTTVTPLHPSAAACASCVMCNFSSIISSQHSLRHFATNFLPLSGSDIKDA